MGNLILEYVPPVLVRLFKYLWHSTPLFGSPVITPIIESIVYDDTDDLDVVRRVFNSE